MLTAITFLVGLLGAAGVSYGAWQMYPPAGYIVAGVLAMVWSLMMARAASAAEYQNQKTTEGDQ